jgi:hypothetical protein
MCSRKMRPGRNKCLTGLAETDLWHRQGNATANGRYPSVYMKKNEAPNDLISPHGQTLSLYRFSATGWWHGKATPLTTPGTRQESCNYEMRMV